MATTPLRVAFVGAGNMARLHLHALRRVSIPHEVAGVHDVSPPIAAQFAAGAGARPYPTLERLLSEAKPQLVHICTPAGTHFGPAREALVAGAHVYVEKPFVETPTESDELLELAQDRHLLICTGHQLLRDPGFQQLMGRGSDLEPAVLVDSYFAFRAPRLQLHRASPYVLASQLLDVLPHPLYTLVAALERFGPASGRLEIAAVSATPVEIHALLRKGDLAGRLFVSLRARPVASTLAITGVHGTLTADFIRAILVGTGNEGSEPLEKIANPFLEAAQLAWRSGVSLARRFVQGGGYPGLVVLLEEFYRAVIGSGPPPISVDHLRSVTAIYHEVASHVRCSADRSANCVRSVARSSGRLPVAVVTGAGGFLGNAITRELVQRGFVVRGVGRGDPPIGLPIHEWVRMDLAQAFAPNTIAGAAVVVHAAAATSGGFASQERDTAEPTRNLLLAMKAAEVQRLVYVSSLSVLRIPKTPWERQTEQTPLAESPELLGPYTWGKCVAEALVTEAQKRGEIEARIVRPAALIDLEQIELPGLLGRRLFGGWYLALGRPGLPLASCDVHRAGAAIAWCAERFDEAPRVVNLIDRTVSTRGELIRLFRQRGWRGRVVWVPIPLLAGAAMLARMAVAITRPGTLPPLAVWSILRIRRYDTVIADAVFTAAEHGTLRLDCAPQGPARGTTTRTECASRFPVAAEPHETRW